MLSSWTLTLLCTISCIIIAIKSQTTKKYNDKFPAKSAILKASSADNILDESDDDYDKTKNPFYGDKDDDECYDEARNPFHDKNDNDSGKYLSVALDAISNLEKKIPVRPCPPIPFPPKTRESSIAPETSVLQQASSQALTLEKKISTRPLPPPRKHQKRRPSLETIFLEQTATGGIPPTPPPRRRSIQRSMESLQTNDAAMPPRPLKTFEILNVTLKWKTKSHLQFSDTDDSNLMEARILARTEDNSTVKTYILQGLSNKHGPSSRVLHLEGSAVVRPNPYYSRGELSYRIKTRNLNPKVFAILPDGGYISIKKFTNCYIRDKITGERYDCRSRSAYGKLNKKKWGSCQVS